MTEKKNTGGSSAGGAERAWAIKEKLSGQPHSLLVQIKPETEDSIRWPTRDEGQKRAPDHLLFGKASTPKAPIPSGADVLVSRYVAIATGAASHLGSDAVGVADRIDSATKSQLIPSGFPHCPAA